MIYFILADDEKKRIKIGRTSCDVEKRLAELQTGCPIPLKVLFEMEGSARTEAKWKRRFLFHKCSTGGDEWFDPVPKLLFAIMEKLHEVYDSRIAALDDELRTRTSKLNEELASEAEPKVRIREELREWPEPMPGLVGIVEAWRDYYENEITKRAEQLMATYRPAPIEFGKPIRHRRIIT